MTLRGHTAERAKREKEKCCYRRDTKQKRREEQRKRDTYPFFIRSKHVDGGRQIFLFHSDKNKHNIKKEKRK